MNSTSKLSTSSVNMHKLDSPDAVIQSSLPASNQVKPVLSERKANPALLLGENGENSDFGHYFGDLVLRERLGSELPPENHFNRAVSWMLHMPEDKKQSAVAILLNLLKARADIYTRKASETGTYHARESLETAKDMLLALKVVAEGTVPGLDEANRARIHGALPALEAQLGIGNTEINYGDEFNQLTANELFPAVLTSRDENKDVSSLFKKAAYFFGKVEQAQKKNSLETLIFLVQSQTRKYLAYKARLGNLMARKEKQTGRDMLNTLKALAKDRKLDETHRAIIKENLPALEETLKVEYENQVRYDKEKGICLITTQF